MKDTLKSLLRTSVIVLIIGIILICVLLRVTFDKVSGMILDGIQKTGELIDISADGLNIGDYIVIENGTIKIGGKTVEFGKSGISDSSSTAVSAKPSTTPTLPRIATLSRRM